MNTFPVLQMTHEILPQIVEVSYDRTFIRNDVIVDKFVKTSSSCLTKTTNLNKAQKKSPENPVDSTASTPENKGYTQTSTEPTPGKPKYAAMRAQPTHRTSHPNRQPTTPRTNVRGTVK